VKVRYLFLLVAACTAPQTTTDDEDVLHEEEPLLDEYEAAVDTVVSLPGPGDDATPFVSSVQPNSASAQGAVDVVVAGARFASGAKLFFGDVEASNVVVVSTQVITARAPAHAPAVVDVRVDNGGGAIGALVGGFVYRRLRTELMIDDMDTGQPARARFTIPGGLTGDPGGGYWLCWIGIGQLDKPIAAERPSGQCPATGAFDWGTEDPKSGTRYLRIKGSFDDLDSSGDNFGTEIYFDILAGKNEWNPGIKTAHNELLGYAGVRFSARQTGGRHRLAVRVADSHYIGQSCGDECFAFPQAWVVPSDEWRDYTVYFRDLRNIYGHPLVQPDKLREVRFGVPIGEFDIHIDDIRLIIPDLADDFEDGDLEIQRQPFTVPPYVPQTDTAAGTWHFSADADMGLSGITGGSGSARGGPLGEYTAHPLSDRCLHAAGTDSVTAGFDFRPAALPYNAGNYSGVRFWARGSAPSLTGSISGAGNITYRGNPTVDVGRTGAGSVNSDN
jgi:hypothetical protein